MDALLPRNDETGNTYWLSDHYISNLANGRRNNIAIISLCFAAEPFDLLNGTCNFDFGFRKTLSVLQCDNGG